MLGVTKKVPLSGEVRLGSYERPGSAISYRIILLTAYLLNGNFLFSAISLVKVRVRCGVGLGVSIFCSIV